MIGNKYYFLVLAFVCASPDVGWSQQTLKPKSTYLTPGKFQLAGMAISPDRKLVILAGGILQLNGGSPPQDLLLYDAKTMKQTAALAGHPKAISRVAFLPDGKQAISSSVDGTMIVWDMKTHRPFKTFENQNRVLMFNFDQTGSRMFLCDGGNKIEAWDTLLWKAIGSLVNEESRPYFAMPYDKDNQIIVGGHSGLVKVIDWKNGKETSKIDKLGGPAIAIDMTPDKKLMLVGDRDGVLTVWDAKTLKKLHSMRVENDEIMTLSISPDGQLAMVGTWLGRIQIWRLADKKLTYTLDGHKEVITGTLFLSNSEILTGDAQGNIAKWTIPD
jgi:WD40 repeat protein